MPYCVRDFEVDSQDTVHVIYDDWASDEVYYSFREEGQVWSAPTNISESPSDSSRGQVAIDGLGNIHFAWTDYVEYPCFPLTCYGWNLYYRAYISGTLTSPVFIEMLKGAGSQTAFQIEAADDGTAHIVWNSREPDLVSHTMRDADGTWSAPDTRPGDLQQMALAPSGDLHIVWRASSVLNHQWYSPLLGWSETHQAGGESNYDISAGNFAIPEYLHSLHLVYASHPAAYDFRLNYNSFEMANSPWRYCIYCL